MWSVHYVFLGEMICRWKMHCLLNGLFKYFLGKGVSHSDTLWPLLAHSNNVPDFLSHSVPLANLSTVQWGICQNGLVPITIPSCYALYHLPLKMVFHNNNEDTPTMRMKLNGSNRVKLFSLPIFLCNRIGQMVSR